MCTCTLRCLPAGGHRLARHCRRPQAAALSRTFWSAWGLLTRCQDSESRAIPKFAEPFHHNSSYRLGPSIFRHYEVGRALTPCTCMVYPRTAVRDHAGRPGAALFMSLLLSPFPLSLLQRACLAPSRRYVYPALAPSSAALNQ